MPFPGRRFPVFAGMSRSTASPIVLRRKVRITHGQLNAAVSHQLSNRVKVNPRHNQPTGKGMTVAMPRVVLDLGFCQRWNPTFTGSNGIVANPGLPAKESPSRPSMGPGLGCPESVRGSRLMCS